MRDLKSGAAIEVCPDAVKFQLSGQRPDNAQVTKLSLLKAFVIGPHG
jgi:hypothetical protein